MAKNIKERRIKPCRLGIKSRNSYTVTQTCIHNTELESTLKLAVCQRIQQLISRHNHWNQQHSPITVFNQMINADRHTSSIHCKTELYTRRTKRVPYLASYLGFETWNSWIKVRLRKAVGNWTSDVIHQFILALTARCYFRSARNFWGFTGNRRRRRCCRNYHWRKLLSIQFVSEKRSTFVRGRRIGGEDGISEIFRRI